MVKKMTPDELRKLTRTELLSRKKELAAHIRTQADAYDTRRKNAEAAWPDETRSEWDSINKSYDENEQALIEVSNDEQVRARAQQIAEDELRSVRHGQPKPGLDDRMPGEDRSYGDAGFDRDDAHAYAQRQKMKRLVFRSFLLAEEAPELISDEMRDACHQFKFDPNRRQLNLPHPDTKAFRSMKNAANRMSRDERLAFSFAGESRALSSETSTAGPELIPASFINILSMAMLSYGDFLTYVDTRVTEAGEPISWSISDDTANEGEWQATESADTYDGGSGEADPAFLRQTWYAHELHSKWVKVPWALSADSMFDLEFELARMLGERLGRARNRAATVGDGTKKSKGITIDAPTGRTTAAPTAITYDDLVLLEHSVDPAYRADGTYMMHDDVVAKLRLLKDGQSRPLWQASMRDGSPDRINNKPYVYNQHMASSVAANARTILFGRLSDYKERVVRQIKLVKAQERFVETLENGFLAYMRVDGKLQRPATDARCSVKRLVQAAS